MSRPTGAARPADPRGHRLALRFLAFVIGLAAGWPLLAANHQPQPVAASSSFSFNWAGTPASPQPWVPGQVNDWDLVSNIDGPTDLNGSMEAGHGPDCGPPPATHHVVNLVDSTFICKNHMMTAIFGGGDAFVGYGAVYFTPAQLVDWSQGQATVSWKVSTERSSSRDWWSVNLTPFAQNLVVPLVDYLPAYQGEPQSGLELRVDNGTCNNAGISQGTILRTSTISNTNLNEITQGFPCVEDQVPASAQARSQFQIEVSANHLKVFMPGTNAVWYDGPTNLPFNQAVLQFSHHSYNPTKSGGGPGTFHWSDVSVSPATPFTMLRPQQPVSLHEGQNPVLTLPQAAPQDAFLRFAGLGNFQVSFDGGRSFQAARLQGSDRAPEHFASFWTPVPAGTTQVVIRGQPNNSNLSWWVEDLSVWSQRAGAPPSTVTSTPTPISTPTATPVSIPNPTPQPSATLTPVPPAPPTGSIAFRSASTAANSRTVKRPAHVAKGDLLLAAVEVDADPVQVVPPPGWTLLNDTTVAAGTPEAFHGLLYYKLAGGHEPRSYHFYTPWRIWTNLQVLDYTGVDTSQPIDAVASKTASTTANPSSPLLTTTSAHDQLVLVFMNYELSTWTAPAGMSKRSDFAGDSAMDQLLDAPGPIGIRTATTSTSGAIAALAAALRPA